MSSVIASGAGVFSCKYGASTVFENHFSNDQNKPRAQWNPRKIIKKNSSSVIPGYNTD